MCVISYAGRSKDGRTNRWNITLSCGHTFQPWTTMYAQQVVECPKCLKSAFVDYNKQEVREYD